MERNYAKRMKETEKEGDVRIDALAAYFETDPSLIKPWTHRPWEFSCRHVYQVTTVMGNGDDYYEYYQILTDSEVSREFKREFNDNLDNANYEANWIVDWFDEEDLEAFALCSTGTFFKHFYWNKLWEDVEAMSTEKLRPACIALGLDEAKAKSYNRKGFESYYVKKNYSNIGSDEIDFAKQFVKDGLDVEEFRDLIPRRKLFDRQAMAKWILDRWGSGHILDGNANPERLFHYNGITYHIYWKWGMTL